MSTKASKKASKKADLKLEQPSDQPVTDDEQEEFEVVISPSMVSSLAEISITGSGLSSNPVVSVDDRPLIIQSAAFVLQNLEDEIESLEAEVEAVEEALNKKKGELKDKRNVLKKWLKRIHTPTTVENAQLAVVINQTNRQLHNDEDGTLFYRTGEKNTKTQVRLSAKKVSTQSVREKGQVVMDGKKKVSVHLKDPSVTLKDLTAAEETELIVQAQFIESQKK